MTALSTLSLVCIFYLFTNDLNERETCLARKRYQQTDKCGLMLGKCVFARRKRVCLCMCVCVCVFVGVCLFMRIFVCVCVSKCVRDRERLCECVYLNVFVWVCLFAPGPMRTERTRVCVCEHTSVCDCAPCMRACMRVCEKQF